MARKLNSFLRSSTKYLTISQMEQSFINLSLTTNNQFRERSLQLNLPSSLSTSPSKKCSPLMLNRKVTMRFRMEQVEGLNCKQKTQSKSIQTLDRCKKLLIPLRILNFNKLLMLRKQPQRNQTLKNFLREFIFRKHLI